MPDWIAERERFVEGDLSQPRPTAAMSRLLGIFERFEYNPACVYTKRRQTFELHKSLYLQSRSVIELLIEYFEADTERTVLPLCEEVSHLTGRAWNLREDLKELNIDIGDASDGLDLPACWEPVLPVPKQRRPKRARVRVHRHRVLIDPEAFTEPQASPVPLQRVRKRRPVAGQLKFGF
jgi:hypothetical protein